MIEDGIKGGQSTYTVCKAQLGVILWILMEVIRWTKIQEIGLMRLSLSVKGRRDRRLWEVCDQEM